jgi:hypothetical protein
MLPKLLKNKNAAKQATERIARSSAIDKAATGAVV